MVIKAQRGRGKKIHLLLDDEYKITTDIDFWAENFISDGEDISEEEWDRLTAEINYRKAFNKCADLLSRREHSVKELKDKLLRTVDEESAEKAIEKYIELGYLDDEKFAKTLSEYLFNKKHCSVAQVRQELYKKGICREIISEVIDDADYDSVDSITAVLNKNYLRKLSAPDGKDKVIAALMRRGFSYGDIKAAISRIENEEYE